MITEKEIKDLIPDLETYWNQFHNQCAEEDKYYNLEYRIPTVQGYEIQHPETAPLSINDASSQVDTANIRVEVKARNSSTKAQEQAEAMRKFLLGCWHRIYSRQGLVLQQAAKHEFLYGVSCLKAVCDMGLREGRPKIKRDEKWADFQKRLSAWREREGIVFPIAVMVVNPQCIMPDPSVTGSEFFIEKYKRRVIDIRRRWPDFKTKKKNLDEIDWIEYWDKDVACYIAGNEVVMPPTPHNYGFIPYVLVNAGFGLESAEARPEHRYRGLLYPLHARLKQEARLETNIEAYLKSFSFPERYFQGPEEARDALIKVANEWAAQPAAINVLAVEGAEYNQVTPAGLPAEIYQLMGISSSRLQTATVQPVLTGQRETGVRAGYEMAMRAGLAKRRYGTPLFNMEQACTQLNEMFLMYVENVIDDEVTVWGRTPTGMFEQTISPSDIKGYYENSVILSSISPEEEDRRSNLGRVLYQAGVISGRTCRRDYVQLEEPLDEEKQILYEQALKSPAVQQAIEQAIVQTGEMQERIAMATEGKGQPWSPAGNRGIPPSPMPRPDEMQRTVRPIMPGSPEEVELRATQMMQPGGYQGTKPWPAQLGGPQV